MKCEYCGRELSGREKVCPGCGAAVEQVASTFSGSDSTAGENANIQVSVNGINISINSGQNGVSENQDINIGASQPKAINDNPIKYGGFCRRSIAFLIDLIVILFALAVINDSIIDHNSLVWMAIIAYYTVFEGIFSATPGKMIMGMKVVDKEYHNLDLIRALIRSASKILSSFLMGIGYLMVIFSSEKRSLHDRIAGTYVICKPKK